MATLHFLRMVRAVWLFLLVAETFVLPQPSKTTIKHIIFEDVQKPVRAGNGKRVYMWSMCEHVLACAHMCEHV